MHTNNPIDIQWNFLFSNNQGKVDYNVFKEKMVNSILPLTDAEMETLFNYITRTAGARNFKWGSEPIITGSIEPILMDLFIRWKYLREFFTINKSVLGLSTNYSYQKMFGLPSEQVNISDSQLINDENNQYTKTSGVGRNVETGADTLKKLNELNGMFRDLKKQISKMFSPFLSVSVFSATPIQEK